MPLREHHHAVRGGCQLRPVTTPLDRKRRQRDCGLEPGSNQRGRQTRPGSGQKSFSPQPLSADKSGSHHEEDLEVAAPAGSALQACRLRHCGPLFGSVWKHMGSAETDEALEKHKAAPRFQPGADPAEHGPLPGVRHVLQDRHRVDDVEAFVGELQAGKVAA